MKIQLFYFKFSVLVLLLLVIGCKEKMPIDTGIYSEQIRLNQIGYYPQAAKRAVVVNGNGTVDFQLVDAKTMKAVYNGELSDPHFRVLRSLHKPSAHTPHNATTNQANPNHS